MKKYIYTAFIFCGFAFPVKAQNALQRTPDGALYTIFTHNTGDKLKVNDIITIDVIQKTDKDSVLFSSFAAGHAGKVQVQAPQDVNEFTGKNFMDIFPQLTLNDSVLVKIPTDSLFKGNEAGRPPFFPVGSYLNYIIKIEKIQSLNDAIAERNTEMASMKAAEITDAAKYIADNKLVLKTTASGLKYVITKRSVKPKPLAGDTLIVNYTGKLLSGQVFDTNIATAAKQAGIDEPGKSYGPFKFIVGKGEVVKGWDDGFLLLNEGSKATFIIPSGLAYGERGNGPIPPFSTLVFDVELIRVKRIKHTVAKKPLVKKYTAPPAKKKT